jgi:hypothetical protein
MFWVLGIGEGLKEIYEGHDCECVESKKPKLPEGILEI